MATCADVINMALRDAGVLGDRETADASMMSDAFATLQQMLDIWQVDNLYVYVQQDDSFTPTGAISYTVGSGGDINITRPDRITYAYWRLSGLDYPLIMVNTFEEYETLVMKTQAGEPLYAFYRPSYQLGTLYVYPQASTGSIHIVTNTNLSTVTAPTDTITLPPEYIMPIRFSLRELYCSMWNMPMTADVPLLAKRYRTILKRNNTKIPELRMPAAIPTHSRSNIFIG